jgi:hypothetical protein
MLVGNSKEKNMTRVLPLLRRKMSPIAALLVAVACVSTTYAQTSFDLTTIVKKHDASPDGKTFFDCDSCFATIPGYRTFNNKGELLIAANTQEYCDAGGFLISGDNKIALTIGCQQTASGELAFYDGSINDKSQVAFTVASYADNQFAGIILFLFSDGKLTRVAGDGDATPIGGNFSRAGVIQPVINSNGDVVFEGFGSTGQDTESAAFYLYSNGELRAAVTSGDPSPDGGVFEFVRLTSSPQISSQREILFFSDVLNSPTSRLEGLFLSGADGNRKIVADGDALPGGKLTVDTPFGMGNDKGEVAFISNVNNLYSENAGGIYLYSGGQIQTVARVGDPAPIGGSFAPFRKAGIVFPGPALNNNGAIAFKGAVKHGSSQVGIFLASPNAILKVVALGDQLPTGDRIQGIDSFALNDLGQIAFVAIDKDGRTVGVFKATPIAPEIRTIRLKRKHGAFELRIDGAGMIAGDTIIEINGSRITSLSYPEQFRENGGTTTRVVSRDSRLEQLIPQGQAVQVAVFNSLTNLRSQQISFSR